MLKPKFTITNKINNSLLQIERARGFLDVAKLKEERTVTRDLTNLVNMGLLEKHGEKKGTYYMLKLFKGQK